MRRVLAAVAALLITIGAATTLQAQMPDARQMSGIPRPVTDLPDRTISVRVIRGTMTNNVANQPVEFTVDGKPQTVMTGADGRAEIVAPQGGAAIKATTTVDGEFIESTTFPAPPSGGVRMLLVATDKEAAGQAAAAAAAPAVTGEIILSGETRIVVEADEDQLRVYYLLDLINNGSAPVNPATAFEFDLPSGAAGASLMEESSKQAMLNGTHVRVNGPFPPGATFVQIGFVLPQKTGTAEIAQVFPARLDHLGIIVQKLGDAKLTSPLIERQQDMPAGGLTYIAAAGGAVAAGQPVTFTISGLPHHSEWPRNVALVLSVLVVVAGIWLGGRRQQDPVAERRQLVARREKLFQDLVRLENDHRRGKVDGQRYAVRREELLSALEHVYGALESEGSPDPAPRSGVAA